MGECIRRLRRSGDQPVEFVVGVVDRVARAVGAVCQVSGRIVEVGEDLMAEGVRGGDEAAQSVVGHPVDAPFGVGVGGPVAEAIVPEGVRCTGGSYCGGAALENGEMRKCIVVGVLRDMSQQRIGHTGQENQQ